MTRAERKRRAKIRRMKKLLVIVFAVLLVLLSICLIYTACRQIIGTGGKVVSSDASDFAKTESSLLGVISNTPSTDDRNMLLNSRRRGFLSSGEVPLILQQPELPTGCEVTAVTMVLQAYGYSVDKLEMADSLPRAEILTIDGRQYISHPEDGFFGDPRGSGYGVFSPILSKTAQMFIKKEGGTDCAISLKGKTEDEILYLIDEGLPVCVWSTMYDLDVTPGASWYVLRDGRPTEERFTWPGNEHCMVLVGYNDQTVTVMDPLKGKVNYPRDNFFRHYEDVGSYALVIV